MNDQATETIGDGSHFDVVIMGGGFAGIVQALHLRRHLPQASVLVIEPQTPQELARINKIGESTVEIAVAFMVRDLGLADYLAGNFPPKYGLNFHWAKRPGTTKSVDDYFSSWVPSGPQIPAYQLHRGKFERDMTQHIKDLGVAYVNGKVAGFEVGAGTADHSVRVKLNGGDELSVTGTHLVDAAGRNFLIGKKLDNIQRKPEDLYGLDTVSSWIHVKGVDPSLLQSDNHDRRSSVSGYYATNHWFGDGHWCWTIPIDGPERVLSIGITTHAQVHPAKATNTQERFFAFLKEHHEVVHDIAASGEVEDFHVWLRPAHKSKVMFSPDAWYVVGDSAYFGDPFYSMGTSSIGYTVTSVTEIIRARMAGEPDAEERREAIDKFNRGWADVAIHTIRDHYKHLGNASAMSWRIYLEYIWWFGFWVPLFVGRWHLDKEFLDVVDPTSQLDLVQTMYEDITEMVRQGRQAGFADAYQQNLLGGGEHFAPPKHDHVEYLADFLYRPQELNIYRSLARSLRWVARWTMVFNKRAFGMQAMKNPSHWARFADITARAAMVSGLAAKQDIKARLARRGSARMDLDKEFESYVPPTPPVGI